MRQFFEIIIYKYHKWTSRWEKDLFVGAAKVATILGFINLLHFFSVLSVIYPPMGLGNPKSQNYLLLLYILLCLGAINYFVFFKGKGCRITYLNMKVKKNGGIHFMQFCTLLQVWLF